MADVASTAPIPRAMPHPSRRRIVERLTVLVLVAAAFRIYAIDNRSLWLDEIASVYFARQPLALLWSDWIIRETNPPLYYSLLHYWIFLFGDGEAAVRSLSAVLGLFSIPLTYLVGREIASRRVGMIAALLAAVWTPQITFSQEARAYILGLIGVQLAILGLCRIARLTLRKDGPAWTQRWPWLAYGAGCLIAIYSHTTLFLFPLLANVFFAWLWWFSPRSRSALWLWLATNVVCAVGALWWAWITLRQLSLSQTNIYWIPKPSLLGLVLNTWWGSFPHDMDVIGGIFSICLLGLAILGLRKLKLHWAVLLTLFGVGGPLVLFVVSQHTPVLLPRTVFWTHVALLLAIAAGIASFADRRLRIAIAAIVVGLTVADTFAMREAPGNEPWRETISVLNRILTDRDVLVFDSPSVGVVLDHYCRRLGCNFPIAEIIEGQVSPSPASDRWAIGVYRGAVLDKDSAAAYAVRFDRFIELRRGGPEFEPLLLKIARLDGKLDVGVVLPSYVYIRIWRPIHAARN